MASEQSFIAEYGKFAVECILGILTGTLACMNYKKENKIKTLQDERDYLKRGISKITSKVEPESDRTLVLEADKSVQIMGINSLGPLHHCREEIIEFLIDRKGILQILLVDPKSEAFANRAELEKDFSQRLLSEWRASISILKDIQLRTHAQIELRLRFDRPDRSLFIVDAFPRILYRTKMLVNY
jgi:hypothetical protein